MTDTSSQASSGQTPQSAAQPQRVAQYRLVDLPELAETFADSIQGVFFDGQTLRIEFCVSRLDEIKEGTVTGRKFPCCRLVLTPSAAVDLINRMQQVGANLTQAGLLKATQPKS